MFRCCLLALSFVCLAISVSKGAEFRFRQHDVDRQSIHNSCAAIDVNHDGKLDIVTGGSWYEAPSWNRHFLRSVELIGGRYDDYSSLPLDVNEDGWIDFISCNYRSQSLYWVEHPGQSLGQWPKHVIDTPGRMETGRLADIDGDGRMDVLPNGTNFAAWWELITERSAAGPQRMEWIRHDLPSQITGHGVGFGDVNGDGRGDIVGPRGWLEAPSDPRRGRWIWRPEFQLHRDGSIPILVHDVDRDGDNDLIWGRGHQTGLYWLEQAAVEAGDRKWFAHVIDTSWSQPHSLLLADVDNDGQLDLVAGKRYLGHDGKDLGEYDPLVIYWYKFDPARRTWHRHVISPGGRAGFGLDPKAVDIDQDGDLDLLVADRSGLYLFENLLVRKDQDAEPLAQGREPRPSYDDHSKLLIIQTGDSEPVEVKSAADWGLRRRHILHGMQAAMGSLPDSSRRVPLDIQITDETTTDHYVRREITYATEPGDRVPAYLLVPKKLVGKAPAMLCLHPTSPLGKAQVCGLGGQPSRFYAHELAERGYVCLAPDYPSFGDYNQYNFQSDDYVSGTMKAIWNNVRAIDVLQSLVEADGERIGVIGHSLGGHNALFTAPFDLRVKAVVTSCGFTAFHHYYGGNLKGWTSDRYMPLIRDVFASDPDRLPFDFYEVLAATAPRPIFINAPLHDTNFDVRGVEKVVSVVRDVYGLLNAENNLTVQYPDCGHDFPDEVRRAAYDWLDRQLTVD